MESDINGLDKLPENLSRMEDKIKNVLFSGTN